MSSTNNRYIASTIFKTYVNLFSKLMDLPSTVILNVGGFPKEHTVFHRLELLNYDASKDCLTTASLSIKSYAIRPVVPGEVNGIEYTEINPEFEYSQNSIFWAGLPTKVFKDFSTINDKKFGALSWCASYERDLHYPSFLIELGAPIFTMEIKLSMLLTLDIPETKVSGPTGRGARFVGSVDADGSFTPVTQMKPLATESKTAFIHKEDSNQDTPKGPTPSASAAPMKPSVFKSNRPDTPLATTALKKIVAWFNTPVDLFSETHYC